MENVIFVACILIWKLLEKWINYYFKKKKQSNFLTKKQELKIKILELKKENELLKNKDKISQTKRIKKVARMYHHLSMLQICAESLLITVGHSNDEIEERKKKKWDSYYETYEKCMIFSENNRCWWDEKLGDQVNSYLKTIKMAIFDINQNNMFGYSAEGYQAFKDGSKAIRDEGDLLLSELRKSLRHYL